MTTRQPFFTVFANGYFCAVFAKQLLFTQQLIQREQANGAITAAVFLRFFVCLRLCHFGVFMAYITVTFAASDSPAAVSIAPMVSSLIFPQCRYI